MSKIKIGKDTVSKDALIRELLDKGEYWVDPDGKVYSGKKEFWYRYGKRVGNRINNAGYRTIMHRVRSEDGTEVRDLVLLEHRMVFIALKGPIPEGHQIDHVDCVKTNNHPDNLEAVTQQENMRRALANGLRKRNSRATGRKVKYTDATIRGLKEMVKVEGRTFTEVGKAVGIHGGNLAKLIRDYDARSAS